MYETKCMESDTNSYRSEFVPVSCNYPPVGRLRNSNRIFCLFREEAPKLPIYSYVLEENLLHAMC